ncbi:hypothetical protein ABC383_01425 [Noviherbaspirillum sp. 1P10PC]|uniref:hypothetical protein n=1 Tax=Noviherbaspirillum sp. 1P10PC TaxID=3132292 RepID=UPI0039A2A969
MTALHARCLGLMLALALPASPASAQPMPFSFGAIGHVFRGAADDGVMRKAIIESDADNLAFVVVNGVKAVDEPCSDALYDQRLALLSQAKNGVVLSLAGSDWADCKRSNGRPAAMERLTRVRDVYFQDEMSFGATRLPLSRQSTSSKFRSYAENARWEVGNIVFATVNLPAPNNHYLTDAGRNGEFEDRLIANRYWLQRTFTFAQREKRDGIVLFCDGNPALLSGRTGVRSPDGARDGFAEVRRQILALAGSYGGKVLVVHGSARLPAPKSIRWRGNLGELALPAGWLKVNVRPEDATLFSLSER